ncbi:hypothetical protein SCWH03_54090 [Streptomyces pacificus]|uniref:Cytochrome P450 n=1 Tax=Streptomyces pacificus TaxID=2705029 RepID=A0A6A0B4E4_9ACTN|nr:hypothetical protein SCWH03_54090 [Streptomyces pacificus]
MRTPETPTSSSTPEHPATDTVPDSAAPPRDFPIQRGCPFAAPAEYDALRAHDPVARVTLPTKKEAWVVTRYDDVRELLSDPRVSADIRRPNFPALDEAEQEAGARFRPSIRRVSTLRLAGERDEVAVKHDSATFGLEELMVTW